MKLNISIPNFPGFYSSNIDLSEVLEVVKTKQKLESGDITQKEFDKINWSKTNIEVAKHYLAEYRHEFSERLQSFGIKIGKFVNIDRPQSYNFSTDELICQCTINKRKLKRSFLKWLGGRAILNESRMDWFEQFLSENYKDRSGFISFYSHDADVWLTKYLDEPNNCIIEGLIKFLINDTEFIENFGCDLLSNHSYYLVFK